MNATRNKTVTLPVSTRAGNMFRSITGNYEAATPLKDAKGFWVITRAAIRTANRYNVKYLRTFRQAGPQTTAELISLTAQLSWSFPRLLKPWLSESGFFHVLHRT